MKNINHFLSANMRFCFSKFFPERKFTCILKHKYLADDFKVMRCLYFVFVACMVISFTHTSGECERFVTSLKTNKCLVELDLCENLIGTAEVSGTIVRIA